MWDSPYFHRKNINCDLEAVKKYSFIWSKGWGSTVIFRLLQSENKLQSSLKI